MKKILFSMVMAMLLLQSQGDSITIDGLTWNYDIVDGEAVLSANCIDVKTAGEIIIPQEINGCAVASIGADAFKGCNLLTSVIMPDTVTSIRSGAFSGCTALAKIVISENLADDYALSFGYKIFENCSSLVHIEGFPQYLCKNYSHEYFEWSYKSVTNIVIAKRTTLIEARCFKNFNSLTKITIPADVSYIGDEAFYGCSSLEEIIFEGDAPTLGADVFAGVPRRMKIRVKEGSVGWNGTASSELPEYWKGFSISHLSGSDDDTPGSSGGNNQNPPSGGEAVGIDPRYDLAEDIADRAIANVEIDGDTAIDSFVLKDGKVYDAVVRIVNVSAADVKVSLPADYKYEKFKGTNPLVIPASSTNLLTITRTKGDTFLLSREELVLEEQK